jgi:thioesterase domain-containing protein/acyl carrier protein
VAAGASEVTGAGLRARLAARLAPHELPATFALVESLPRASSGKLDRAALRAAAAALAEQAAPYVEPRTAVEARVAAVFADVLGVERVGALDEFFQLGGDSLSALALQAHLHRELGQEVSLSGLLATPTVEALAAVLEADTRAHAGPDTVARRDPLLVALTTTGPALPLVIVPGGGGNAFQLRPLAVALTDRPTSAFLPRGVERAAVPDLTVRSSARRYRDALLDRGDPARTILAGYSYGGLVAQELARLLAARGRAPALLVLLDPSPTGSRVDDYRTRRSRALALPDGIGSSDLAGRVRLEAAVAKTSARQALLVPRVALRRYDPQRRGDVMYQLSRRQARWHRPRPYGGPTLLIRSRRPPSGGGGDEAELVRLDDGGLLTGPTEVVELAGSHHDLMRPPLVTRVAAAIDAAATRFT